MRFHWSRTVFILSLSWPLWNVMEMDPRRYNTVLRPSNISTVKSAAVDLYIAHPFAVREDSVRTSCLRSLLACLPKYVMIKLRHSGRFWARQTVWWTPLQTRWDCCCSVLICCACTLISVWRLNNSLFGPSFKRSSSRLHVAKQSELVPTRFLNWRNLFPRDDVKTWTIDQWCMFQ